MKNVISEDMSWLLVNEFIFYFFCNIKKMFWRKVQLIHTNGSLTQVILLTRFILIKEPCQKQKELNL